MKKSQTQGAQPTHHAVIGSNLRRLRLAKGLRQDELATIAQRMGLRWTQATVARIESGDRALTVGELLLLQGPFNKGLAELVRQLFETGASTVDVEGAIVSRGTLEHLAGGTPVVHANSAEATYALLDTLKAPFRRELRGLIQRYPIRSDPFPDTGFAAFAATARASSAEQKAARRLGVPLLEFSFASLSLWDGRTLSEERDARAALLPGGGDERSTRGHVTRALIQELERHIQARRRA